MLVLLKEGRFTLVIAIEIVDVILEMMKIHIIPIVVRS